MINLNEKESNLNDNRLNILLTQFTYFNDSKFNHIIILATVFFGQFQIKSLAFTNINFVNIIRKNWLAIVPELMVYLGLLIIGVWELFRIKFYSKRTFELDIAIRNHYPGLSNVQKQSFRELMGSVLFIKNWFLNHVYRLVGIYLLVSLFILII
jgi:hypothetical protein